MRIVVAGLEDGNPECLEVVAGVLVAEAESESFWRALEEEGEVLSDYAVAGVDVGVVSAGVKRIVPAERRGRLAEEILSRHCADAVASAVDPGSEASLRRAEFARRLQDERQREELDLSREAVTELALSQAAHGVLRYNTCRINIDSGHQTEDTEAGAIEEGAGATGDVASRSRRGRGGKDTRDRES